MINQTQLVLFEALNASLFGIEPNFPCDTDWNSVISEAKEQTVFGLINDILPQHNEAVDLCKASYMRIMYEQEQMIRLLDGANIPFVILKGSSAAMYYPKPYLRTMGDIDLLVKYEHYLDAISLFEANGFVYQHGKGKDGRVLEKERNIVYIKNDIIFELHKRFSSPGYNVDDLLEDAINRREYHLINGYSFPALPDVENGLVLIGHIYQHLKENKLGLRQIIDWEMYIHNVADKCFWRERFIDSLKSAGLLELAVCITDICNNFLGLPDRIDWGIKIENELSKDLLNMIMSDGNFGRKAKKSLVATDERGISGAAYGIKRFGFFKYFYKVGLSTWSLCKKHKFFRIFAFFYGIFRQSGKGIMVILRKSGFSKQIKEGKKRYELYRKLGIINENK